jgi:hypothetical protein
MLFFLLYFLHVHNLLLCSCLYGFAWLQIYQLLWCYIKMFWLKLLLIMFLKYNHAIYIYCVLCYTDMCSLCICC